MYSYKVLQELMGKTLCYVERKGDEEILFVVSQDEKYKMYHEQDCCESVTIEDICGELEWLTGSPILRAEIRHEDGECGDDYDNTYTWTFFELATLKGAVTIRWYGTSNGYYSESAHFKRIEKDDE